MARAESILEDYVALVKEGHAFSNGDLNSYFRVLTEDREVTLRDLVASGRQRNFGKKPVAPKSSNQRRYVEAIERNDLVFGIGPAGTGKTYLAVAMAISALLDKQVSRIILTRPAVEAGERLGFLPGTLQEKVDPYLRPLYDALYDMLEADKVEKLLERRVIEVAPLAFMRGRTLNDSFIIMDEAQNSHARTDEDDPHAPGLQLQDGGHRRHHADRSARRQAQRPGGSRGGAARRGGHPLHLFRRAGRGAPHSGAADRQGLRALPGSQRRRPRNFSSSWRAGPERLRQGDEAAPEIRRSA